MVDICKWLTYNIYNISQKFSYMKNEIFSWPLGEAAKDFAAQTQTVPLDCYKQFASLVTL